MGCVCEDLHVSSVSQSSNRPFNGGGAAAGDRDANGPSAHEPP